MKHPEYDLLVWVISDVENNEPQRKNPISGNWEDCHPSTIFTYPAGMYRRKPKRVTINGVEINAPLSKAPAEGTMCCFLSFEGKYMQQWDGLSWQAQALANGRVFATEEDAKAAYDAVTLALTGGKQ